MSHKEKMIALFAVGGFLVLHFYAKKRGLTLSVAASQILGEQPKLGGQAQYANGTQAGPQSSTLTDWAGTFRDVPLYQDNSQYSGY